jgi:hypothetical protein
MNRIRAWYVEQGPHLEKYFVVGTTDDMAGIYKTLGGIPNRPMLAEFVSASPFIITVLNAVLVASIVGLAGVEFGLTQTLALLAGVIGAVLFIAVTMFMVIRFITKVQMDYKPMFPGPGSEGAG